MLSFGLLYYIKDKSRRYIDSSSHLIKLIDRPKKIDKIIGNKAANIWQDEQTQGEENSKSHTTGKPAGFCLPD